MRKYYIQLLESLIKAKVFKDYSIIKYQGKIPSYNAIYATPHWKVRNALKDAYHLIFKTLLRKALGKPDVRTDAYSIYLFFNSRLDPDNMVGIEKWLVDTLVERGYVVADSKRHFKTLLIVPDLELPNNTVEFYFIRHNDES